jgi:hypothetical protein
MQVPLNACRAALVVGQGPALGPSGGAFGGALHIIVSLIGELYSGVDVRGASGYAVSAPSGAASVSEDAARDVGERLQAGIQQLGGRRASCV